MYILYAEAGLLLPMMPLFSAQQISISQLNYQPELLSNNLPTGDTNLEKLMLASSVSEYDLGVEGDLFKAPEPILELPVLALHRPAETMMVTDDDELINDVFYNCKNDLIEKSAIVESLPQEAPEGKLNTASENQDTLQVNFLESIPIECLSTEVLEQVCADSLNAGESSIALAGEILLANNYVAVIDEAFRKSVSLGSLNAGESACGSVVGQDFFDVEGSSLENLSGITKAQSEEDIQIGNVINEEKIEERRQKLIRYKNKRANRNFDRKIKYACRKALAESQPRIRGRFAKIDGNNEKRKAAKQQE